MQFEQFRRRRPSKSDGHLKGFTLLECLVALFVVGIFVLLMNSVFAQGRQIQQALRNKEAHDFEVFMMQLENELAETTFVEAKGPDMKLSHPEKGPIVINVYDDKIRKTPGYQPLLMRIRSASFINHEGKSVKIKVVFQSGEVHHGKWTIPAA